MSTREIIGVYIGDRLLMLTYLLCFYRSHSLFDRASIDTIATDTKVRTTNQTVYDITCDLFAVKIARSFFGQFEYWDDLRQEFVSISLMP